MRIPRATYRLQLHAGFPFDAAREALPYLDSLGISDVYLSPVLEARTGSMHGYDVTDPRRIREELGGEAGLERLSEEAHRRDMGVLLDIVPNHMAASVENPWWRDVLRSGTASPHATAFDIDWEPARTGLAGKVLLPVLAAHYGEALEKGEISVVLSEGGIEVAYGDLRLPLSSRSQATVIGWGLARFVRSVGPASPAALELAAIVDDLTGAGDHAGDASRGAITRLLRVAEHDPAIRAHIEGNVRRWNVRAGEPASVERLDRLLDAQSYRLAYWPVADQEINYRRFFDLGDLVAVRVEDDRVFDEQLAKIVELVQRGVIDGLRIDHVDGLHDPERFLRRLREAVGAGTYIVVEKILAPGEELRAWPVQGTTGYEVLNAVNDVFVDPAGLERLGTIVPDGPTFADEMYAAKRHVITELFGGELRNLAQRLGRLAEQHRHGKDLTLTELGRALVGVTASLPVYRTYIDSFRVHPADRSAIEAAVEAATRRDPDASRPIAFMRHVLLLDIPPRTGAVQRATWLRFVMRWQQLASAAMAKGQEDTAFYRYVRLASRNEVGGAPGAPPRSVAHLHELIAARAQRWPAGMSASATHDTKRGEDVRARIDALSDVADETAERFASWRRWCVESVAGASGVDEDMALLIFESLVGAWPLLPDDSFAERIAAFAVKAGREAKRLTSWRRPSEDREAALAAHARAIVDAPGDEPQRVELERFVRHVAERGARLSLVQKVLTITLPGVPDVYQGTELWDLSLVDPDNRRPVDLEARAATLARLSSHADDAVCVLELFSQFEDGAIKLHVTARALRLRAERARTFEEGRYTPLLVDGRGADTVIAFARGQGPACVLTIAACRGGGIVDPGGAVALPPAAPRRWTDALTSEAHQAEHGRLRVGDVLRDLPVALLIPARD